MFEMKELKRDEINKKVMLFPLASMVEEWKEDDIPIRFSDMVSTLGVEVMLDNFNGRVFQIAGTDFFFMLRFTAETGEEGMERFKKFCTDFHTLCSRAVPQMPDGHSKEFLEKCLKNFEEEGVYMPHYGKIL